MAYLYPHLPADLPPCAVAITPKCRVLQRIPTTSVNMFRRTGVAFQCQGKLPQVSQEVQLRDV